jgi:hypothetical protein
MLGAARWSIRRFIEADPDLTLVADANQADAVICVGTTAPEGMPAVVLAPPTAPTDWRTGEPIGPLTLGAADLAADDPVMTSVELAGVAVRRVRPWIATGDVKQVRLVTLDGDAFALRTPEGTRPRRVWIAIDPASENTDLAVHYPLLIWLHNATAFVLGSSPEGAGRWTYEHRRASLSHPGWRPMDRYASGVLGPGIYTAGHRDIRAVNLLGLRGGRPQQDPVARARELPLPAATRAAEPIELWWASALIAGACWLAGWWLRMRAGRATRDGGAAQRPRA